jgi:hypothetical protein
LYNHPPPSLTTESEKLLFIKHTYTDPASVQYENAQQALLLAQSPATINRATAAIEKHVKDQDHMLMGKEKAHQARVIGRFKREVGEFTRVNLFPHQSGYIMTRENVAGGSIHGSMNGSVATSVASLGVGGSSKKGHKKSSRAKDHSWRV